MKTKWKNTIAAVLLTASLVASPSTVTVFAQEASDLPSQSQSQSQTQSHSQATFFKLTDKVQAELKSVFSERTADSTTIGAVIRLQNNSTAITRVPDYELRIFTSEGISYTLTPSATNPRSIQPKGKVELAYMLNVNRTDSFTLTKLSWVHVDEYVYPRQEKTLLSLDISGKVWQGVEEKSKALDQLKWGQSFTLDIFSPHVTYTPIEVQRQNTNDGNITIVKLKAKNSGTDKAFLPNFVIGGTDGKKLYAGERMNNKTTEIGAGETKNIQFAIPADANAHLNELIVLTPEHFAASTSAIGTPGNQLYHVGHVRIGMPINHLSIAGLKNYVYDTPITFDPSNELMDKDVQVSLVELHKHDNQGEGYKTLIAKFKLQNTGKLPVPVPVFQAELVNGDGYTYAGVRQNTAAAQLMPGLIHVVSYAFNVPKSEDDDRFALRLLDGTTNAPYSSTLATIGVNVPSDVKTDWWNLYPFKIKMNHWSLYGTADTIPVTSYSYKLNLDLDIEWAENVVVDAGFSRLKIEIADSFGKMLGSETIPFVGPNRLISGKQAIRFNSIRTEQYQYPLTINFYEVIDTPTGEASRLIHMIKQ